MTADATATGSSSTAHGRSRLREVLVVVPAANEEQVLGRCLESLAVAERRLRASHPHIDVVVVVALDGCRDSTALVVGQYPGVQSIAINVRSAGAARRAGVAHGLSRSGHPRDRTWIASTDADSRVPVDWLSALCRFADAGHHAVFGTVRPDPGLADLVQAEWFSRHQLVDDHPHVHGANMSVRADVYEAVGGWSNLTTGEDVELARRLADTPGVSIARTGAHPVTTSVRFDGRAPGGFSGYLRALAEHSAERSLDIAVNEPDRSTGRPDQETIPSS